MLAPLSAAPTTGQLPSYAEPPAPESPRAEASETARPTETPDTETAGSETGDDSGAGDRSDGTLGATLDAALSARAREEAPPPDASDDDAPRLTQDRLDQARTEALEGYDAARSAIGMTE